MILTYPTMKLLHICFCLLFGTALSGCEIPMTAQDRIAVTRICEVLELKAQVAAAVWPGFDDPQFEVPLVYFTDSLCYAVNPEARFLAQYPATLRYRDGELKIYTTPTIDSLEFHMQGTISLDPADAGSAYNYRSAYLLCSSPKITARCIPGTEEVAIWRTMVLHEYFHGFQFRHPAYLAQFEASGAGLIPSSELVGHYQRYGWYKESVDRENAFLLDALGQTDAGMICRDIDGFRKLRAERHARMRRELAPEAVGAERVYETMEGTARYIEFHACPGGYDLDANDWLYRTDISQYMYATGFNIVRLLDKLGVDYKTRLFDEGLALDGLLPE